LPIQETPQLRPIYRNRERSASIHSQTFQTPRCNIVDFPNRLLTDLFRIIPAKQTLRSESMNSRFCIQSSGPWRCRREIIQETAIYGHIFPVSSTSQPLHNRELEWANEWQAHGKRKRPPGRCRNTQ
jgi:hypothetical protein